MKEPGPVVSAHLADDIAKKVFDLIKSDFPNFQQSPAAIKEERELLDSKLVFVICSFSEDMEPVFEGISAAAKRVGLEAKRGRRM